MGKAFFSARKEGADVGESFLSASMQSERRLFVEKENQKNEQALGKKQRENIASAVERVKLGHDKKINQLRKDYLKQCEDFKKEQKQHRQEQRQKWREYRERRQQNYEQLAGRKRERDQSRSRGQSQGFDMGR